MYKPVASLTRIKGEGGCEAFMNGLVIEELRRQQEQRRIERRADAVYVHMLKNDRDALKKAHRLEVKSKLARPVQSWGRIKEAVATAWAWVCAVVILSGEAVGMWVRREEYPW